MLGGYIILDLGDVELTTSPIVKGAYDKLDKSEKAVLISNIKIDGKEFKSVYAMPCKNGNSYTLLIAHYVDGSTNVYETIKVSSNDKVQYIKSTSEAGTDGDLSAYVTTDELTSTLGDYTTLEKYNELHEIVEDQENILTNKQDKLTAGDNITIENNVISASGPDVVYDSITLYNMSSGVTAMVGLNIYNMLSTMLEYVKSGHLPFVKYCKIQNNYSSVLYEVTNTPVIVSSYTDTQDNLHYVLRIFATVGVIAEWDVWYQTSKSLYYSNIVFYTLTTA